MKLSAAEDAIRAGKPDVALGVLREAWYVSRHPRLSELIERLSSQLTTAKGPVTAKTVGQLHEAALALHAKQEPAELGRLLQVRWPGTWQKGVPLLEALLKWPEDPRVEAAIAGLLAEPPWDSNASWGFFTRLRPRLEQLSDPRVVPALEAAQGRSHPYWYEREFRPIVDATLKRLRSAEFPLDADTSAALDRLESYFAESKAREKDKSRGEAELLADIHARPNDLQARAVFADWLTERNDPRGELITLQLSPSRTRAQETRLNALMKAHGSEWAGPLDEWFEREPRIFEAGFLTGGRFLERLPRKLEDSVQLPGWRLLKTLELRRWSTDITPLLDIAPLEALHSVEAALFTQIALGPPRPLLELTCGRWVFDRGVPKELEGELPGLPHLKTLGIQASAPVIEWMKHNPLFKRLRRLRVQVYGTGVLGPLFAFVRDSLPNIIEIELFDSQPDSWMDPSEWRLAFRRAGPGSFTELEGVWSPGRGRFSVYGLSSLLGFAEAPRVTKLDVRAARTLKLSSHELEQTEENFAPFVNAAITVPWERKTQKAPAKKARTGPTLSVQLTGETLLQPDMEPLWQQLQALGLRFDSYGVGYGSAHRSLGPRPAVTLSKWGKNPRCANLKIYEDGADEELWLDRPRRGTEASVRLRFHWVEREVEPFLAWLEQVLDRWKLDAGAAWSGEDYERALIGDSGPPGGWLTVFGPSHLRYLPEKALGALTRRFPGSFVRKTKRNLMLAAAAGPLEKQRLDALGQAVNELVVDEFTRVHGVDFLKLSLETFAGPASALGLKPAREKGNDRGDRSLCFRKDNFELRLRFFGFLSEVPRVEVGMHGTTENENHSWWLTLANEPFAAKTLPDVFQAALTALERDAARWMSDPANFHGKRRR